MERLQQQIRDVKKEHRKEKEKIIEDFSNQINKLDDDLKEKTREVDLMQSELKMVKEFRRKRGQMQKELDEVCWKRYSKTCLKQLLKKNTEIVFLMADYRLMQVKSIAECSNWSILQYFSPTLSYHLNVIKFLVLFIFEWPLKTGFTVYLCCRQS